MYKITLFEIEMFRNSENVKGEIKMQKMEQEKLSLKKTQYSNVGK